MELATQSTHGNIEGVRTVNAVFTEDEALAKPDVVPTAKILGNFKKLPTLAAGAAALKSKILEEAIADYENIKAANTRMTEHGKLYGGPMSNVAYTHQGLSQLVSLLGDTPRGTTGVLEFLSPLTRAAAYNDIAVRTKRKESLVFRTMVSGEQRIVRAVTSDRHSLRDGDDLAILEAIEASLPSNALVRFTRQWDRSDFEIILPTAAYQVKQNDPVYARLHITNSETKGASLNIHGGLFRLWCLNGMARPAEDSETNMSVRHIGNPRKRILNTLRVAILGIDEFAQQFGAAHQIVLQGTQAETLERTNKAFPELSTKFLQSAGQVWNADGELSAGHTLAGLANAITRAAQDLDMERAAEAQVVAGTIISRGEGF